MKTLLIIAGSLVAIVAAIGVAVYLIGSRLPEKHTASRSIRLKQSPADVYAVVRNFASAPEWRPDLESLEVMAPVDGKVRFRESGSQGVVNYQVDEDVRQERIVTRILDTDLGYSGAWTYEFTADAGGCLVTITENGEVSNVFFRFMSRYVFGHTATIDRYLKDLGNRFGETYQSP